jgi:hypothetical protein
MTLLWNTSIHWNFGRNLSSWGPSSPRELSFAFSHLSTDFHVLFPSAPPIQSSRGHVFWTESFPIPALLADLSGLERSCNSSTFPRRWWVELYIGWATCIGWATHGLFVWLMDGLFWEKKSNTKVGRLVCFERKVMLADGWWARQTGL